MNERSMTGGSREERIAGNITRKVVSGKSWNGVKGMRSDIDEMAAMMKVWIVREKEMISEGRAGFSYSQYYGYVIDALDECSDKLKKVEGKI